MDKLKPNSVAQQLQALECGDLSSKIASRVRIHPEICPATLQRRDGYARLGRVRALP